MQSPRPVRSAHNTPADSTEAVDAFMARLDHPSKAVVQALRKIMLALHPSIAEGIKWNSPSFRTTEYFATTNLRAKSGVGVILHLGAKVRELPGGGLRIADEAQLLKWLGKDRAMVEFKNVTDLQDRKSAFQAVVRQWIEYV